MENTTKQDVSYLKEKIKALNIDLQQTRLEISHCTDLDDYAILIRHRSAIALKLKSLRQRVTGSKDKSFIQNIIVINN